LSQDSAAAAGIIDVAHLTRVTFGEKALAAEVLGLFDRQAEMLLARMQQASPRDLAACAHTLAGSARGVGAWGVAAASLQVELAAKNVAAIGESARRLEAAIRATRTAIAELLSAS
jgi:hypothetical protein